MQNTSEVLIKKWHDQFMEISAGGSYELDSEIKRLRKALKWALEYIADGTDKTPAHDCDFNTNPEKGVCDFHEAYWNAHALLVNDN